MMQVREMEVSPIAEVLDGKQEWCLIQGDCLDKLREIPSGTIDAVVADPHRSLSGGVGSHGALGWQRNSAVRAEA